MKHLTVVPTNHEPDKESPCIGVCELNDDQTACAACGQTLAELAGDDSDDE